MLHDKFTWPDRVLGDPPKEWLTSDVVGLAQSILADQAWDRLPILADALEEAGCNDPELLQHCRHVVHGYRMHSVCWHGSCWLVDWLLGKPPVIEARWMWDYENARTSRIGAVPPPPTGQMSDGIGYAIAINPGEEDGRTWLVYVEDCYDPPLYVVEARYPGDVFDIFVDSKWGEAERIADEDMKDYITLPGRSGENPEPTEYRCNFTDSGHAYDSESMRIVGREPGKVPFYCVYFGPGIPHAGILPSVYSGKDQCLECNAWFFPGACDIVLQRAMDGERFCSPICYAKNLAPRGFHKEARDLLRMIKAKNGSWHETLQTTTKPKTR